MMEYIVNRTDVRPRLKGLWDGAAWGDVEPLDVACFLRDSSDHRPQTLAKLLYDDTAIYGIFKVRDQYVRCRETEFQGEVWFDSCVEFFFQPDGAEGYFNFEFNCGGALLAHYNRIDSPGAEPPPASLDAEDGRAIGIHHSLPPVVDPELEEETTWLLEFAIPFAVLSKHVGEVRGVEGWAWRANFYKCAEANSHPHWASWSPLEEGQIPNFHQPECFGTIRFAENA
ncbi:MAG: carbohydrate-binding family 9-like protein [Verrucomicrobiota bacterium]